MEDLYVSRSDQDVTLHSLVEMMRNAGVTRLLVKVLAPNDNSKNQPYLGGDLGLINIIPTGSFEAIASTSAKPGGKKQSILRAPVRLSWMDTRGRLHPAPNTKLILYPQYPEVRFSGFVRGADAAPSTLMDPTKQGRVPGRLLFLGIRGDGQVLGFMAAPDTQIARALPRYPDLRKVGVFLELPFAGADAEQGRITLLRELARIHARGWILSRQLVGPDKFIRCVGPRCVGHTLEAELRIMPNARAAPDFEGWEVKALTVKSFERTGARPVTLMTPEPSGGFYGTHGAESFVRRFGSAGKRGSGKLHFTGRHVADTVCAKTSLTLRLLGYDASNGRVMDPTLGIALTTPEEEVVALWPYAKLIDHWKKKHDRAAYVPALTRKSKLTDASDLVEFKYGGSVTLAMGTDFALALAAIARGSIYFDPGTSLGTHIRARSQFRILMRNIPQLYHQTKVFDLAYPLDRH